MSKEPMQADGGGRKGSSTKEAPNEQGESQGGAYPNPHTSKKGGHFDGGQSGKAYHGSGQLGDQKVGEQHNAPSKGD